MAKLLRIESCCQCFYFEFDGKKDRTYCNFYSRRIIPKIVDPSDAVPKWCPLPETK